MKTIRHICIDVRGVLKWKSKDLVKLFKNTDGTKATAEEIKDFLYDKLSEGYEVISTNDECDNFDKIKGCLGHTVNE